MPSGSSPEEPGYLAGVEADKDQDASQEVASQDANTPDPSAGGDEDANQGSILEAVQRAAKQSSEASSSDADADGEKGQDADQSDKSEADKEKEAEGEKDEDGEELPPFHKHPRWQKVQGELKELRPKAEVHDRLVGFMQESGLTNQEVNQGFEIMRLLKSDPAKAAEALQPYLQGAQQASGEALPPDLQQQVEDGYISDELAKEMAQLRTKSGQYQAQTERARHEAEARLHQDVSRSVSDWENDWKSSDPDYAIKQPRVMERIELAIRRDGFPSSTQAAVQLANKVKQEVDREFAQLRPQRQPKKPVSGQAAKSGAAPEPKSMREAMELSVKGGQ